MDPFTATGAAASIIQLVETIGKAIQYLSDIKDEKKERSRLSRELGTLCNLLLDLEDKLNESNEKDQWMNGLRSLALPHGPIEQLKEALAKVLKKLEPKSRLGSLKGTLLWPFDRKEIEEILGQIERQKSTINYALQGDQMNLQKAIKADTGQIPDILSGLQGIKLGVNSMESERKTARIQRIVEWMSPLNFADRQYDVLSRSCGGTGQWFLETLQAKSWVSDPDKSSLWCSEIPGAGKTTIAAIVSENLQKSFANDSSVAVASIYCNYKDKMAQTPTTLLASIWAQIRRESNLDPEVEALYDRQPNSSPRLEEVCKILRAEVYKFSKVFVIVDAFDESEPAYRLRLLTELRALQPKLKLMITSRFFDALGTDMGVDADIEILASDSDIKRFVQETVKATPRLQRWISTEASLLSTIIEKITEAAQQMFLMAKLLMDSIRTKMTRKALQVSLEELPKTLRATYDDALDRINKQNEDEKILAERILSWVSYAFRPLDVMELRHALAVTPGEDAFDPANMPDEEDLTSVCAGLIFVEEGSKVVRLAHYTAQDYLDRIRDTAFAGARHMVAATCLTYLAYEGNRLCRDHTHYVYRTGPSGYYEDYIEPSVQCPYSDSDDGCEPAKDIIDGKTGAFFHKKRGSALALFQYAAYYWARHIKDRLEEALEPLAMKLLLDDNARSLALAPLRSLWWITRIRGPLTIAVHYNLRHLSKVLLKHKKHDVNDEEGESYHALLAASELGRDQIIKLFLEYTNLKSSIEADRNVIRTPVAWVAWTGNRSAVRLLLSSANLVTKETPESSIYSLYETQKLPEHDDDLLDGMRKLHLSVTLPLIAVLSNPHTLQEALSKPDVDVQERDPTHEKTALHHASQSGRTGIVRLLLAAGASPITTDYYGETPLHYAVDSGNLEVVKLLVLNGADLSIRNQNLQLPTEMFRVRPGDIPCPVHQDERWEETHEFLMETVIRRKVESRAQKMEFGRKYGASWREFNKEAREGKQDQA